MSVDGKGVVYHKPVAIAGSASGTGAIDLEALTLVGITKDATAEGTALTLKGSATASGTLAAVRNSGGAVSITVTATTAEYIALDPALTEGLRWVEVDLTTQTGATTITLHLKRLT